MRQWGNASNGAMPAMGLRQARKRMADAHSMVVHGFGYFAITPLTHCWHCLVAPMPHCPIAGIASLPRCPIAPLPLSPMGHPPRSRVRRVVDRAFAKMDRSSRLSASSGRTSASRSGQSSGASSARTSSQWALSSISSLTIWSFEANSFVDRARRMARWLDPTLLADRAS